jgi:hypothetical protein
VSAGVGEELDTGRIMRNQISQLFQCKIYAHGNTPSHFTPKYSSQIRPGPMNLGVRIKASLALSESQIPCPRSFMDAQLRSVNDANSSASVFRSGSLQIWPLARISNGQSTIRCSSRFYARFYRFEPFPRCIMAMRKRLSVALGRASSMQNLHEKGTS